MKLNGWLRLWILVTFLYGLIVALVAVNQRPTIEELQYNWISDVAELVAERLSMKSEHKVYGYEILDRWTKDRTNAEVIQNLLKLVKAPTEVQKSYAEDVRRLNQKHMALVAELPRAIFLHILVAIAWWLGPAFTLLVLGWALGWVIRGFREK